jgi:hypothetical protein
MFNHVVHFQKISPVVQHQILCRSNVLLLPVTIGEVHRSILWLVNYKYVLCSL